MTSLVDIINLKRLINKVSICLSKHDDDDITNKEEKQIVSLTQYELALYIDQLQALYNKIDVNSINIDLNELNEYKQKIEFFQQFLKNQYVSPVHLKQNISFEEDVKEEIEEKESNDDDDDDTIVVEQQVKFKPMVKSNKEYLSKQAIRNRLLGNQNQKNKNQANGIVNKELEKDKIVREDITDDMLNLIKSLQETSLSVQKSLGLDAEHISVVDNQMDENLTNVNQELERLNETINAGGYGCRYYTMLIGSILIAWIAVFIFMKIT